MYGIYKFFHQMISPENTTRSKNMIFFMFHQSDTAFIKTPVTDYINEIGALFADKSFQPYLKFESMCVSFCDSLFWFRIFLIFDFSHILFLDYNFQDVFFSQKLFVGQDFPRICFFFFIYTLFGSGFSSY